MVLFPLPSIPAPATLTAGVKAIPFHPGDCWELPCTDASGADPAASKQQHFDGSHENLLFLDSHFLDLMLGS